MLGHHGELFHIPWRGFWFGFTVEATDCREGGCQITHALLDAWLLVQVGVVLILIFEFLTGHIFRITFVHFLGSSSTFHLSLESLIIIERYSLSAFK